MKTKWILTITLIAGLTACPDKPQGGTQTSSTAAGGSTGASTGVSSAASSAAPPAKSQGSAGKFKPDSERMQLPGIDELFAEAFSSKETKDIFKDLPKTVKPKAKDFSTMKSAEKPIEVGIFLADLAVVSSDPDKDVPQSVMEDAQKAVNALNPPESVRKLIDDLVADMKKGLKGKDLRTKIDHFMSKGASMVTSDPKNDITARLVRLGAFVRLVGRISKALDKAPDTALVVLSQKPDEEYALETLGKLSDDQKKESIVAKIKDAIEKVKTAIEKDVITADDAKVIREAFAGFVD